MDEPTVVDEAAVVRPTALNVPAVVPEAATADEAAVRHGWAAMSDGTSVVEAAEPARPNRTGDASAAIDRRPGSADGSAGPTAVPAAPTMTTAAPTTMTAAAPTTMTTAAAPTAMAAAATMTTTTAVAAASALRESRGRRTEQRDRTGNRREHS
jgi:hypothetical protein